MSIFVCLNEFGHKIGFLENVLKSINHTVYDYLDIKGLKITKNFFYKTLKIFCTFLVQNGV